MADASFVYRPRTGPVIAAVVWAMSLWAAISLLTTPGGRPAAWLPACALASLTAWMVFAAPKVHLRDDRLEVHNVAVTYDVPWAAISRIDTKWALTLITAQDKITAFAAPAPSSWRSIASAARPDLRHLPSSSFDAGRSVRPGDLPGTASGDLAWVVRERWQKVCQAGPTGAASGLNVTRHWHRRTVIAWVVLAAASVLLPILI
ncbi:MAG: PH domain-containing protein [Bifidobacteriaceae bacterium]|jgi:hypothetical protein|nr:PH domain-containing protein [Bifidobacteriaceae bacterium]